MSFSDNHNVGTSITVSPSPPVKAKLRLPDRALQLEIIQATTSLIDPGCSVWDEYGIQRSGRRFFTTRCTNMKVDKHDIELQCRWSTDRANGVRTVQRSMIHNYSEVRNMKHALIRPSKAC
jgi:hypothetical protein